MVNCAAQNIIIRYVMPKWRCTSREFVFYHHDISIVTYKCVSFTSQCPVMKEGQNKYNANGINKHT